MISRKMLRAFYVLLCLYVPNIALSTDNEESVDEIQYDYINADHERIVQATLDKRKSPQELLDVLSAIDHENKSALLNTVFIAHAIDEEDDVRYTTLAKELLLNPSTQNGEINNRDLLKLNHLLAHGFQPDANLLHEAPDGTLHFCTLPLFDAVYMGNVEATQLLLAHGASPDKDDAAIMMRAHGAPQQPESYSPRGMLANCLAQSILVQNNAGNALPPPAPRNRYELIAQLFNKE